MSDSQYHTGGVVRRGPLLREGDRIERWMVSPATGRVVVPMSAELVEDQLRTDWAMAATLDYVLRPWTRPDRNPFPTLIPAPRLARLTAALTNARIRITTAAHVLRHGAPEEEW